MTSIVVAGIGNVFHGDDGFGPAVALALLEDPLPDAHVEDYGIRGVHLAYDLVGGPRSLVLVDAVHLEDEPGTVVAMEPEDLPSAGPIDGHALSIEAMLARARLLGATLDEVVLVGCVPSTVAPGMGLSPAVEAAVPVAASQVRRIVADLVARASRDRVSVED